MKVISQVRERFNEIAREFLREMWIKRAIDPKIADAMEHATGKPYDREPHYPGRVTQFVELELDGQRRIFRFVISEVTEPQIDKHRWTVSEN